MRAKLALDLANAVMAIVEDRYGSQRLPIAPRKRNQHAKAKHMAKVSQSIEQLKPWEAQGISRVTYYRRRKRAKA